MKRKNLIKISLLLAAVMTLTGCSKSREYQYYPPLIYDMELGYIRNLNNGMNTVLPDKIGKEYEETLENIFDNINIMGVTLSLPMNVSDLPEGFTVTDDDDEAIETCDGKYITFGEIKFGDDINVCQRIFILRGKKQDVSQGIIVGFEFGYLAPRSALVYDKDGHNLVFMSPSDVTTLLGETTIIYDGWYDHIVYTDAHGRRVSWMYDSIDSKNEMAAMSVVLTAHSALDFEHMV